MAMPGQGGAGQGYGTVLLRESNTGKLLKRGLTDNISESDITISWKSDKVFISYLGYWDLPPPEPGK